MKVITIREPYASLIEDGIKQIETRSWKTNYRGKLLIHAGKSKVTKSILDNEKLMALVKNKNFNYGKIICECELVDCIYMDAKFIKKIMKNHQEFICGEYKIGRYAWILKNIKVLDKEILAKGKLGLWNY